jgi:uncharacterized membrane protein YobD (UPF0266 family)
MQAIITFIKTTVLGAVVVIVPMAVIAFVITLHVRVPSLCLDRKGTFFQQWQRYHHPLPAMESEREGW